MSVRVSREEKLERLREIRETVNEFPIIPVFKDEAELRWSLDQGNVDFIANLRYWTGHPGEFRGIFPRLRISPIKPWCYATAGYSIRAMSYDEALDSINKVVEDESGRHEFIYFRVAGPWLPWPQKSYVDEAMEEYKELEYELSRPDEYVRSDLHDR